MLIRGRRRPIIGMVTMDQLLVDLGDVPAEPDDDVVLIGRQGDDEITATEWGERLGTISYEVVTGIGARVSRAPTSAMPGTDGRLMAPKALKRTGLIAGATAGASGSRTRPSARWSRACATATIPTPASRWSRVFDEARILDSHDGGTIYTISRGDGPPSWCSATASRCRRACGPSSSRRSRPPDSAPSRSTRAATASRGSGDTGHSLDNLADDLRTVLEALDLRDVVLVGHSMGGMAVQAFAIRHPDVVAERVAGLVLLSTSSHNLVSDAKRVRGRGRAGGQRRARRRHVHAATQPRAPARAHRVR